MTKETDRTITLPLGNPAAMRLFEQETGAIPIVVVTDPEILALLDGMLREAVDSCFGPDELCVDDAYDLFKQRIELLNNDREVQIPLPSFGMFGLRLRSDERSSLNPRVWLPSERPPRDLARERRRRELWFDACDLFLEMHAAGQLIDGECTSLSNRSLKKTLPALMRAVGGDKEGMEPPSPRWFRREVTRQED
ncbi:hypothetical protein QTL95_18315 [Rhizobium sp. S152]|uniref:hypothetical protein n=1 Tax=Rhizobium sp. S152 TaxID=3055038 RepID=UPI0025A9836D|nr:hypothetical protein [Rhizobium sp. S152]MDM9627849.1 hypothetical protein [Rhizobium sp. S152]